MNIETIIISTRKGEGGKKESDGSSSSSKRSKGRKWFVSGGGAGGCIEVGPAVEIGRSSRLRGEAKATTWGVKMKKRGFVIVVVGRGGRKE